MSLAKIVCLFDLTGIPAENVTEYLWPTVLMQTIELPVGIICCCIPTLAPVWKQVSPTLTSIAQRLLSRSRGSSGGGSQSGRNSKPNLHGDDTSLSRGLVSSQKFHRLNDSSSAVAESGKRRDPYEIELSQMEPESAGDGISVTREWTVNRNQV